MRRALFAGRRKAVPAPVRAQANTYTFPAAVNGWVTNESLVKSKPMTAQRMDNFRPTATGMAMRGGCIKRATIGEDPVESFIIFNAGGTKRFWACDSETIRDITTPADADTPPPADVIGQTSGYYSHENFTTSGGAFVVAVNGSDALQLYSQEFGWSAVNGITTYQIEYDAETAPFAAGQTLTGATSGATATIVKAVDQGTTGKLHVQSISGTFQDNETITSSGGGSATSNIPAGPVQISAPITGVATSLLSHVWKYRNRLFFVAGGTMNAHFLGVDAVGGALGTLNLSGVFQKGGALLFGGTWSQDAGDGLDDMCLFITTEGEVAVYQGSNPAGTSASEWNLVGRYDVSPPMGKRTMRAGGELVVLVKEGMVPVSAAVDKDVAALSLAAITRDIEPDWKREAVRRTTLPWEVVKWPEQNYAIVSMPRSAAGQDHCQFVVNLETGKWCRFTGWPARCMELHNGRLYFGTDDGEVFEADIGGNDAGQSIYYTCVGNPDHLKSPGQLKTVLQARATFITATPIIPKISFSVNYSVALPPAPNAANGGSSDLWDVGLWDQAKWDQPAPEIEVQEGRWLSIGKSGFVFQPQIQITGFLNGRPNTEFVQLDVTYEGGGVVV